MSARRPASRTSRAIAVSIGIFLGLAIIEGMSRALEGASQPVGGLDLALQPYMMFFATGHASNPVWRNQAFPSTMPS
jgi:hypothetical protein